MSEISIAKELKHIYSQKDALKEKFNCEIPENKILLYQYENSIEELSQKLMSLNPEYYAEFERERISNIEITGGVEQIIA